MNYKEYKVIKDFAAAKKGDILTYDPDLELFIMDESDENSARAVFIDKGTADEFVEKGYLALIECDTEEDATTKLCKIAYLVDTLSEQYQKDHDDIIAAYNNQEVPTCVKVEADTVYFNMNQILMKVKEIINE